MRKKLIVAAVAIAAIIGGTGAGLASTGGAHVGDDNDTNLPGKGQQTGGGLVSVGDVELSADCFAYWTSTGTAGFLQIPVLNTNTGTTNTSTCDPSSAKGK